MTTSANPTQIVLRKTEHPGTDHNSKVWVLRCSICGWHYGANSTDAWERRCPNCQGGKTGLPIPNERKGEDWNREELVIAFNLYSQIPFGTIHMRNPKVIELAAMLGRSPGSVSWKLTNFARLDPALKARGIQGSPHGAKGEEEVWQEFSQRPDALVYESAQLLAARTGRSLEIVADVDESDLPPPGLEREAMVRIRVNQSFFRKRVLSAYEFRCCVTGLGATELLVASHIIPWAEDPANRLNPKNGLCLNALHDRAFDRHLMWIDSDFTVRFAASLHKSAQCGETSLSWMIGFEGSRLKLPKKFTPDAEFLRQHTARCMAESRA
jgi:putative restriction endonuclease